MMRKVIIAIVRVTLFTVAFPAFILSVITWLLFEQFYFWTYLVWCMDVLEWIKKFSRSSTLERDWGEV